MSDLLKPASAPPGQPHLPTAGLTSWRPTASRSSSHFSLSVSGRRKKGVDPRLYALIECLAGPAKSWERLGSDQFSDSSNHSSDPTSKSLWNSIRITLEITEISRNAPVRGALAHKEPCILCGALCVSYVQQTTKRPYLYIRKPHGTGPRRTGAKRKGLQSVSSGAKFQAASVRGDVPVR
jgi:hypothetical protein